MKRKKISIFPEADTVLLMVMVNDDEFTLNNHNCLENKGKIQVPLPLASLDALHLILFFFFFLFIFDQI